MKGLDTPILLEILEGRTSAKKLLSSLEGEEVCTTEANLFELTVIAKSLGAKGLPGRLAAVERLRRELTVLPIDGKASSVAALRWREKVPVRGLLPWLILGAVEAYGCSEWITTRNSDFPPGSTKLKITRRTN